MKIIELTYLETHEINGGSQASDSFWYGVGCGMRGMWEMIGSGGGGYVYGKCGY